jgi:lysozyme
MYISLNGIKLIKFFESFKSRAYICPAGLKTIGYGHVIHDSKYDLITMNEYAAHDLLIEDIAPINKALTRYISVVLNQNQIDALYSFIFNVGIGAFKNSTLRKQINSLSNSETIFAEFLKWSYINGKKSTGLYKRRVLEAKLFLTKI